MKKKLLLVFVVLVIGFVSFGYYQFVYRLEHKYDDLAKVLAVPEGASDHLQLAAYQGPHPSLLPRPIDTHSSLIKLGEVGPSEALFAGDKQYPFLCGSEESKLGQPLVDNQDGIGVAVYDNENVDAKNRKIIGYSKDCLFPTRAWYYYQSTKDNEFYHIDNADNDMTLITVDGKEIPFIVRLEMGTINRFIYSIAVLKGANDKLESPDNSHWNKKLIYQFNGGVGIGRRQGVRRPGSVLSRRTDELKKGYAVISSTANETTNHYNIMLSEDTAIRVKQQFNLLYGQEDYMVGIGGSGGAIQQYLIAQNNPQFLDAAIALYSYPDMVTQTTYVFDCELLEYYFDMTDKENPKWQSWENRILIEGLNAKVGIRGKYSTLYDVSARLHGSSQPSPKGMSECTKSWRGIAPMINNPNYYHRFQRYSEQVFKQAHWTYWEDLKTVFGVDDSGYAQQTYDNVGVQYGLQALLNEQISIDEFLKLNASIGGWKNASQMANEHYWIINGKPLFSLFSPWGDFNMTHDGNPEIDVAARTKGSIDAMQGAYRSGNVFLGKVNIPIIDLRHYLDDELDMHHASASFSARQRFLNAQGHADNQLMWMGRKPHSPLADALEVVDTWLTNLKKQDNPDRQIALRLSQPENATDRCYNAAGDIVAQGKGVWDGIWNNQPNGDCMKLYPTFTNSRIVAGDGFAGDIFKCALQSVDAAFAKGIYKNVAIENSLPRLRQIFPEGVCDYTQADVGRPLDIFK